MHRLNLEQYNMRKVVFSLVLVMAAFLLGSCTGSKKVAYFQNADTVSLAASKGLYDAKIMPKDLLTITVSTTDPTAATPFNLSVQNTLSASGQLSTGGGALQQYLVDNDGNIQFPIIGTLHVEGLTKNQCQDLVREKILPYMAKTENPIVTVRMASYRVTVIGEVNKPGVVPVATEKMSILEALAQAGDLSIYGKRENVMLIRENADGEKEMHRLNMNDANLINSPYFYLQQNDIVYVEPNSTKAKNSDIGQSTSLWFSATSILVSMASLLYNILKK